MTPLPLSAAVLFDIVEKKIKMNQPPLVDRRAAEMSRRGEAYNLGRLAYSQGKKAKDNPYDGRTTLGRAWLRGFKEAHNCGKDFK